MAKQLVDSLADLSVAVIPRDQLILLPKVLKNKIEKCLVCKLQFSNVNCDLRICSKCNYCTKCNTKDTLVSSRSMLSMYGCVNCAPRYHCDFCKESVLYVYYLKWVIYDNIKILDKKILCEDCYVKQQCYDCKLKYIDDNMSVLDINTFVYITNVLHNMDGTRPLHRTVCKECYKTKPEDDFFRPHNSYTIYKQQNGYHVPY